MEARAILLMMGIGLLVIWGLRRSYRHGLAIGVALLVVVPASLRLELGGSLPEFTAQRLIFLILLLWAMFGTKPGVLRSHVPLRRTLLLLMGAQFVSLWLSADKSASFKSFLAFSLEVVAFYILLSKSLMDREQIERLLRVMVVALSVAAAVAWVERRWDFSISNYLVTGEGASTVDVASTYPHRIILGYAMAMCVPVLLALITRERGRRRRRRLWGMLLLAAGACYFSNSRGPWVGLAAGAGVMALYGAPKMRRRLVWLGVLAIIVVLCRPGIRDTLVSAFKNTFYAESLKGRSYEYRWRLWYVAYAEISESPGRFLFGYGGLSTEKMDLAHYFERESGGTTTALGYTSWDNQLACNLIEFGVVGFLIELAFLFGAMRLMLARWHQARAPDRTMILAFAASCFIYIFALTNVYIFSPQLKFLFWTLLACGIRWSKEATRELNVRELVGTRPLENSVPIRGGLTVAGGSN